MKVVIELSMLVVQTKHVTVEVPNDFDSWDEYRKQQLMASVYKADDGDGFEDDNDAMVESGTHHIIDILEDNDPTPPDFSATDEDTVERIENDMKG